MLALPLLVDNGVDGLDQLSVIAQFLEFFEDTFLLFLGRSAFWFHSVFLEFLLETAAFFAAALFAAAFFAAASAGGFVLFAAGSGCAGRGVLVSPTTVTTAVATSVATTAMPFLTAMMFAAAGGLVAAGGTLFRGGIFGRALFAAGHGVVLAALASVMTLLVMFEFTELAEVWHVVFGHEDLFECLEHVGWVFGVAFVDGSLGFLLRILQVGVAIDVLGQIGGAFVHSLHSGVARFRNARSACLVDLLDGFLEFLSFGTRFERNHTLKLCF